MVRAYAVAAVLVGVICAGVHMEALAQTQPGWMESSRQIEGRIVYVDHDRLMLSDGTELRVPDSVARELPAGATINVAYEDRGGERVAKEIKVIDWGVQAP